MKVNFSFYIFILSFFIASDVLSQETNYESLIDTLNSARKNKDFPKLADTYFLLAQIIEEERNYEKSFEYLSRALEFYKLNKDTVSINETRFNIARHLLENKMEEDAVDIFSDLRKYYQVEENFSKLAEIELQLLKIYFDKIDVKQAETSLKNTKKYIENSDDQELRIKYIIESITYYNMVQELDTAQVLSNLCIEESLLSNQDLIKSKCLALRANIHLKNGEYDSAIEDYNQVISSLKNINYSKDRLNAYKNLAVAYKTKEEFEKAYQMQNLYSQLQDSILNENRLIAVNNITYKFESRQKSTEIKLLEKEKDFAEESNQQQKRALTVLGIAFAGLLFGIYYIVRFYREKINTAKIIEEQNEKINKQKINELQDKIQINSMQSMIQGQEIERERIAKDLHDSLGGLLSTIKLQVDNIRNKESNVKMLPAFQSATQLIDTAVSEVRSISQNLQPGALSRLGLIPALKDLINRYDSDEGPEIHLQHFDIPQDIDQVMALSVYRIIQEILNNATKHAKAKEILVQLNTENEDLVIHIEDDGIGFDAKKTYTSMGLKNIKSRVNYMKGTIEIDSRKNAGTSFLIHVKLQ